MGGINIRILAKELGLSISTVSKALKDSHEISAITKQKVLAAARRLNYSPNPHASSLRRRRSKTVAVVLPEVADSFFSAAINGIEAIAQVEGYHVLIYLTHESHQREVSILNELGNGRVDGVLLSVCGEGGSITHLQQFVSGNIPLVFFDRVCREVKAATVTTNDFESGMLATQHLLENGCRHIAYLSISDGLAIMNERMQGYQQAMDLWSSKGTRSKILHCPADPQDTCNALQKLLIAPDKLEGIVASAEKLITPVYQCCQAVGVKIPEQLKVVSFSNLATAPILKPALTTITQPAFEMGKAAAELLFKALARKNFAIQDVHKVVPSQLVVRASSQ